MKIYKVIDALEQFAPLPLQEDYDNAGLQIGLTEAEVSGALLCLDVTPQIVEEAIRKGCNLIVSHHPLIFRKLKRIADENEVQKTVRLAIENHVAIVSMHTNLDAAIGGVNSKIAEKIGLQNTQFLGKQQNIDGVCAGEGVIGWDPYYCIYMKGGDTFIHLNSAYRVAPSFSYNLPHFNLGVEYEWTACTYGDSFATNGSIRNYNLRHVANHRVCLLVKYIF